MISKEIQELINRIEDLLNEKKTAPIHHLPGIEARIERACNRIKVLQGITPPKRKDFKNSSMSFIGFFNVGM